ncbi:lipid acyl hydrolase [Grosmannia clavigera kw1407]|uniref:Lipid acyl hydrolase n=1 Tax=Grosmannia clavigera (strain kw1407 / UAMH 11150) TaxID=655863 RepID=F0XIR6_GROCL|nr:lipid acyl hydrolase [Grosmannia clavigera kw1407]EFX02312.1 lipid acyl hydrolase [Grosmannia clavigera kw1407]
MFVSWRCTFDRRLDNSTSGKAERGRRDNSPQTRLCPNNIANRSRRSFGEIASAQVFVDSLVSYSRLCTSAMPLASTLPNSMASLLAATGCVRGPPFEGRARRPVTVASGVSDPFTLSLPMDDVLLPPTEGRHGASKGVQRPDQRDSHLSVPPAGFGERLSSVASQLSGMLPFGHAQSRAERRLLQLKNEQRQLLQQRIESAETYEEWEAAARQLDKLEQHDAWKRRDNDSDISSDSEELYNPQVVAARLQELETALASGDMRQMLHLVRTALSRNVGGISSGGLYRQANTGTKQLVERYVQASVALVEAVAERSRSAKGGLPAGLTHGAMLEQLLLARTSYGRSALVLSGGSVYGMAHIGVLKALFERRLLPRIISGTSAGSIVAAVVCTRTDEEMPGMLSAFAQGDLAVFTDKDHPDSWLTHIGRVLRFGTWHDSRHLSRVMRGILGDMTFQEAFNRTRRILNITVSSRPGLQLPSLLNYLTAPDVMVWSAVVASCSIPGVFDPRPLLVRDGDSGEHVPWDPAEQLWIDGSLDNDVPVERLGEMLNVNHFIVSQTNPHIVLLVDREGRRRRDVASAYAPVRSSVGRLLHTAGWLGKSEAIYCLESLVDLGVFRDSLSMAVQMLSQKYTADINILPRMSLAWGSHLIRNPTAEFMLEACRVGELATWPSICRIQQTCAVELALDRAVYQLRERIAFGSSQVNLRRFFAGSHQLQVSGSGSEGSEGDQRGRAFGLRRSQSGVALMHDDVVEESDEQTTSTVALPLPKRRRGSGSSIQLLARRRRNRHELETILSEDGRRESSDADLDEVQTSRHEVRPSLAVRRGIVDMSLSGGGERMCTVVHDSRPGRLAPFRQNSLQQLPMQSKTPSPSASLARRSYGFGNIGNGGTGLTPLTMGDSWDGQYCDVSSSPETNTDKQDEDSDDEEDDDEEDDDESEVDS